MIKSSPIFPSLIYTDLINEQIRRKYPTKFELEQHESAELGNQDTYIYYWPIRTRNRLLYTRHYAPRSTLEPRHPRKRAEAKEVCRSLYVTASNSAFGTRGLEASLVPSVYICTGSRGFCVSVSEVTYAAATWQCGRSRPIDASRAPAAWKLAFHGAQISRAGI